MSDPQSFACRHDELHSGDIAAGFFRRNLGETPMLSICDHGSPDDPELCLYWKEAIALRDWLNQAMSNGMPSPELQEISRLRGLANVCLASKPTSGMMRHTLEQIDGLASSAEAKS